MVAGVCYTAMMLSRVPGPPLSAFVSVLWYSDGLVLSHSSERHMPDGSTGIVISLEGARPFAVANGPRSTSAVLRTSAMVSTLIGAQFTPGGASVFFDVRPSDLRNASASFPEVAGRSSAELHAQLLERRTPRSRLDLLERWLHARLAIRRDETDPAIRWAAACLTLPRVRVGDIAHHIGHSSRWFLHRFEQQVGLTPKVFSRVQRFQLALRHLHRREPIDLVTLAIRAGYYDQAHFAHECATIAGMSPTALVAGLTPFQNHVVSDR